MIWGRPSRPGRQCPADVLASAIKFRPAAASLRTRLRGACDDSHSIPTTSSGHGGSGTAGDGQRPMGDRMAQPPTPPWRRQARTSAVGAEEREDQETNRIARLEPQLFQTRSATTATRAAMPPLAILAAGAKILFRPPAPPQPPQVPKTDIFRASATTKSSRGTGSSTCVIAHRLRPAAICLEVAGAGHGAPPSCRELDPPPVEDIANSATEKYNGEKDQGVMGAATSSAATVANAAPSAPASASARDAARPPSSPQKIHRPRKGPPNAARHRATERATPSASLRLGSAADRTGCHHRFTH